MTTLSFWSPSSLTLPSLTVAVFALSLSLPVVVDDDDADELALSFWSGAVVVEGPLEVELVVVGKFGVEAEAVIPEAEDAPPAAPDWSCHAGIPGGRFAMFANDEEGDTPNRLGMDE